MIAIWFWKEFPHWNVKWNNDCDWKKARNPTRRERKNKNRNLFLYTDTGDSIEYTYFRNILLSLRRRVNVPIKKKNKTLIYDRTFAEQRSVYIYLYVQIDSKIHENNILVEHTLKYRQLSINILILNVSRTTQVRSLGIHAYNDYYDCCCCFTCY